MTSAIPRSLFRGYVTLAHQSNRTAGKNRPGVIARPRPGLDAGAPATIELAHSPAEPRAPMSRVPRLLPIQEVAGQLRQSDKTVRRRIAEGELHVHRLGRQLRVSEEDLLAYMNRHRR